MNDTQIILLKLIILHGLTDQEEWLTFLVLRQLSKYAYEYTKQFYRLLVKKLSRLTTRDLTDRLSEKSYEEYYLLGNLNHGKSTLYSDNYYSTITYYRNKACGIRRAYQNNNLIDITYIIGSSIKRYHFGNGKLYTYLQKITNGNIIYFFGLKSNKNQDDYIMNKKDINNYIANGYISSYTIYYTERKEYARFDLNDEGYLNQVSIYIRKDKIERCIYKYHFDYMGKLQRKGPILNTW